MSFYAKSLDLPLIDDGPTQNCTGWWLPLVSVSSY